MNMNEQMKESEESILHTYNRFPVVFEKGQGCYLYDSEGKEYLDFAAEKIQQEDFGLKLL